MFTSTNSTGPFNQQHMSLVSASPLQPTIDSISPFTVSPSDTIRRKAFGAASDGRPNPLVASTAASNTEIISINNSIIGMLSFTGGTDVRSNYVMTGATWTENGAAPNGFFQQAGNEVGTSVLDNSTMETYNQGVDNTLGSGRVFSCFSCHNTNTIFVSHDFPEVQPLTSFSPNPGYSLSSFPANLFTSFDEQEQSPSIVTSQISVIPQNGFDGPVTLSAAGLPNSMSAKFDPNPTTSTSTLTLTVGPQTPVGVSTVEILSRSGALTSFTAVSLTVSKPGAPAERSR